MKSLRKAILFGLAVWAIPFVVAVSIFQIRESDRVLFESIMPVAVVVAVVLFANLYFRNVEAAFLQEGVKLGLVWLAISIALDLLMFSSGPMKMSFMDYVRDIGITYMVIPAIAIGFGYLLEQRK